MQSIGDLASFLFTSRVQSDLKSVAEQSANAMSTGQVQDKARHLGGSSLALTLLDRKITLLQQHQTGIAEAARFAGTAQTALARIQGQVDDFAGSTAIVSQIESGADLQRFSGQARDAFEDIVRALNSEAGGRHVFSGTATAVPPLPSASAMLADLELHVAGSATIGDLMTALDTWFDQPTGGFETTAYGGSDTGFVSMPLSSERTATFGLRADDPIIRDTLKALATAVFSTHPVLGFSIAEQKQGLAEARSALMTASGNLIEEQGNLGLIESMIDRASQQVDDDLAKSDLDRLNMVGIDQFEEASRFQASQQQLEVLYRIAARRSGTSLAEYLR